MTTYFISFSSKWSSRFSRDSVLLCSPFVPSFPTTLWSLGDPLPPPRWPLVVVVAVHNPQSSSLHLPGLVGLPHILHFTASEQAARCAGRGSGQPPCGLSSSLLPLLRPPEAPVPPHHHHDHSASLRQVWPHCPLEVLSQSWTFPDRPSLT